MDVILLTGETHDLCYLQERACTYQGAAECSDELYMRSSREIAG